MIILGGIGGDEKHCLCFSILLLEFFAQSDPVGCVAGETVTAEQRHIEFFVLSYVSQVTAENKYNVGLLAFERRDERRHFLGARFISNITGLLAFDPNADVDLLLAFFREIEQKLHEREGAHDLLHTMLDSFSNTIQISDEKTVVISADPEDEIDKLAALTFSGRDRARLTESGTTVKK